MGKVIKLFVILLIFSLYSKISWSENFYEVTDPGVAYSGFNFARESFVNNEMDFLEESERVQLIENKQDSVFSPAKGDVGKLVRFWPNGDRAIIDVSGYLAVLHMKGLKEVSESRYKQSNAMVNSIEVNQYGFKLGKMRTDEAKKLLEDAGSSYTTTTYRGYGTLGGLVTESYPGLPVVKGRSPAFLSLWFYRNLLSEIEMCWPTSSRIVSDVGRFNREIATSIEGSLKARYGDRSFQTVDTRSMYSILNMRWLSPSNSALLKQFLSSNGQARDFVGLCLSYVDSSLYQKQRQEELRIDSSEWERAQAERRKMWEEQDRRF